MLIRHDQNDRLIGLLQKREKEVKQVINHDGDHAALRKMEGYFQHKVEVEKETGPSAEIVPKKGSVTQAEWDALSAQDSEGNDYIPDGELWEYR